MTLALLCSGQGGQHRAMFTLTGAAPEAAHVFEAAADVLGQDPRRFVQTADDAALFANRAGQILCCTQALAARAILTVEPHLVAGYSVGELAAWGCAGAIDPPDLLRLAARRAELMDAVSPAGSGLAGVVGIARAPLEDLLADGVSIAIVNGPDSFVVGGAGTGFARCLETTAARARVVRLRVAVASHTPWLADAASAFLDALRGTVVRKPTARLICGVDGGIVRQVEPGLGRLAAGIANTIDWSACLTSCREAGADRFLELGPGTALARMAGGRAVEEFRTATGLNAWAAKS
jgi:[acyl-carrier-protein] S-malonyltransferase